MTPAERKAAERQRLREAGLAPVEIWVPAERKNEIRRIAEDMRKEAAETAQ